MIIVLLLRTSHVNYIGKLLLCNGNIAYPVDVMSNVKHVRAVFRVDKIACGTRIVYLTYTSNTHMPHMCNIVYCCKPHRDALYVYLQYGD